MILRHSTLQYFTSLHAVHNFNLTSSTAALPQQAQHNIASAALSSSTALILSISMISFLGTFTRSKINYRNSKLVPPGGFGGVLGLSPALVLSTFLLSHHGIVLSRVCGGQVLEIPTIVSHVDILHHLTHVCGWIMWVRLKTPTMCPHSGHITCGHMWPRSGHITGACTLKGGYGRERPIPGVWGRGFPHLMAHPGWWGVLRAAKIFFLGLSRPNK